MNERIKVIVFDLDGTLYQDFTVHKQYLHFMVEGTDKEPWEHALVDLRRKYSAGTG
jgi:FMN phosphatase YigB (HAD superfamily)